MVLDRSKSVCPGVGRRLAVAAACAILAGTSAYGSGQTGFPGVAILGDVRRVRSNVIVEYGRICDGGGGTRVDDDRAVNFGVFTRAKIDRQVRARRNDQRRGELNEIAGVAARENNRVAAMGLGDGLAQVRLARDRRVARVCDCDRAHLNRSPIVIGLEHVDPACGIDEQIWLKCQFPLRNATG